MIYDGYSFKGLMVVENIVRSGGPTVEVTTEDIPGRDGVVFTNAKLGAGSVSMRVFMLARGRDAEGRRVAFEDLRRQVAYRLCRTSPSKLILHDAPDLWNMAILDGSFDIQRFVHTGESELTFLLPDPVWYGHAHEESGEGTAGIYVRGTYPTKPTILVDTIKSDIPVVLDGVPMIPLGSIEGDEPLVFDWGASACTKGEKRVKVDITCPWGKGLSPGVHTVECDAPFTVRWCDRWM